MNFMITKTDGEYKVIETPTSKYGTFTSREEATAAIEVIKSAIVIDWDMTGKNYKDLTKEINDRNREANNKSTTRDYGLKR